MPELLADVLPRLMAEAKDGPLSQEALASMAGVPIGTIQSYLKRANRGQVPKAHVLQSLADALDVKPDVFYEWPIAKAQAERPGKVAATRSVVETARAAGRRRSGPPSSSSRTPSARDAKDQG